MTNPVPGITAENYFALAAAFAAASGNQVFTIDRTETPRQWGAWIGYFASRRIKTSVLNRIETAAVPAEWPHLFDADWREGNDQQAGDLHVGRLRNEQRDATRVIDATARQARVKASLGYNPRQGRRQQPSEKIPEWMEKPPRVDISDFPNR